MQLRAIISIGLAIAFPIVSMVGIQRGDFNLAWLSLPDILICLALIHGLRSDARFGTFLAVFTLVLSLALIHSKYGALFPGLIFILISRYFQKTLEPYQTPLITQMARHIRGTELGLSENALRYTRKLTGAWALLFILLGLCQAILVVISEGAWAWMMGNSLAPLLILLFLLTEPLYRRYRLPDEPRHSFRHFLSRLLEADWKRIKTP